MKRKIAARALIVDDGKLLCTWLKPYYGGKIDFWCLPGGSVDQGEDIYAGLEREIMEELGVKIELGPIAHINHFIHNFKGEEKEHLEFFIPALNPSDFHNIDISKTTHGALEIDKVEFLDPSTARVLPEFLQKIDYSTFDPKAPVQYNPDLTTVRSNQ